ncbi:MAG: hypothetical protein ACRESR_09685 [Gammaproteobacteria bacterium]
MTEKVWLDLNNPEFQKQLFALEKTDQRAALSGLARISRTTWDQIYADRGLNWEKIVSRSGPHGGTIYSLRIGKAFRGIAFREKQWMRFLALHPDHDSTYR